VLPEFDEAAIPKTFSLPLRFVVIRASQIEGRPNLPMLPQVRAKQRHHGSLSGTSLASTAETEEGSREDIASLPCTARQEPERMTIIGYARVSTTDQNLELQENALFVQSGATPFAPRSEAVPPRQAETNYASSLTSSARTTS
jgi:hypothetical protein